MASWDRLGSKQLTSAREAALRAQVVGSVAPFSPFWRARFAALGRTPASVATVAGLSDLPAVGERDVCPDGDPAGAAGLVLQAGEAGYALHAEGPKLRKALTRRLAAPGSYRALVENDTRPTSYVFAGLALRFPVASTRSDLDVVTRAGSRLWSVLGLSKADVVVSALPHASSALVQGLWLAAIGAGSPLVTPGHRARDVAEAVRLVSPTVLVVPAGNGAVLVRRLVEAGASLGGLKTVLVGGAPYDDERAELRAELERAGAGAAAVLAVHVPDGHRLLWGECRPSAPAGGAPAGLHTYPDLDLVQLVDPESGERSGSTSSARELVVTQLGLRGTALLRWRTGDLADGISESPCPACGRTVPRVIGARPAALVPELALRTGTTPVDLRALTSALSGRPDVADWRVVLGRSVRDGGDELLVHIAPPRSADVTLVGVAIARDVRLACGLVPTQVVVDPTGWLPDGAGLTRRVLT